MIYGIKSNCYKVVICDCPFEGKQSLLTHLIMDTITHTARCTYITTVVIVLLLSKYDREPDKHQTSNRDHPVYAYRSDKNSSVLNHSLRIYLKATHIQRWSCVTVVVVIATSLIVNYSLNFSIIIVTSVLRKRF